MLDRLKQLKDPLSITVTNLTTRVEFLGPEDWNILRDCLDVLKPANDLTSILSGEKYPTMSLVIPLIRGLQTTLINIQSQTTVGEI